MNKKELERYRYLFATMNCKADLDEFDILKKKYGHLSHEEIHVILGDGEYM